MTIRLASYGNKSFKVKFGFHARIMIRDRGIPWALLRRSLKVSSPRYELYDNKRKSIVIVVKVAGRLFAVPIVVNERKSLAEVRTVYRIFSRKLRRRIKNGRWQLIRCSLF